MRFLCSSLGCFLKRCEDHQRVKSMKTIKRVALIAALLVPQFGAHAITNAAIAVSGTNIVLSWPSYGYEIYLIQSRQTLNSTNSWSCVTNAYPANGTNQTTFTIYGVVPPPSNGGGGSFAAMTTDGDAYNVGVTTGPMVMPADGSGSAVPLILYPPGFDLSGFTIFDPSTGESVSGSGYTGSGLSLDDPQPLDGGSGGSNDPPAVAAGFFEVYHIPNFPAGITNYTFDGPTFIPVDFTAPDADPNYVDSTTVLINGQQTDYAQFMQYAYAGATNWGEGIYFDRFPNGTNTLQLITSVRRSDNLNDETAYIVFSNAPVVITIGNLITFTNWADLIWNNTNCTFSAQSSVPNVDWESDIYDAYGQFVNYQTNHSSDGNIAWTWNLVDYWGNPRNNPDSDPFFYPYITITQNSGNSAQNGGIQPDAGGSSTRPMPAKAAPYPSIGGWIVAYMDNFYSDGRTNYDASSDNSYFTSGINALAGTAASWNIPVRNYSISFGRSYTQLNRDISWSNLVSWLYYTQYRNFYYFGHGSADVIGCDMNTVDVSNNITGGSFMTNSKAYLKSKAVSDNIAFNSGGARPYRFVFLDGCNTANGNFAPAFGIPKQAVTGGWYFSDANTRNIRPSAFVGWNTETGTGVNRGWGTVQGFWNFRTIWIGDWATPLGDALDNAFDVARDTSGWVDPSKILIRA